MTEMETSLNFRPSFQRSGGSSTNFSYRRRNGSWCQNLCGWFSKPSLPFVIGILALGGIACTLGGIVLGCTGLVEHSTQYLSAALLMIGIGVSMLVIAGAVWRLSLPDDNENCPCYRHMNVCRNCNSAFCPNRFANAHNNYLYSEFQHPAPPPSYLTSFYDCPNAGFCGVHQQNHQHPFGHQQGSQMLMVPPASAPQPPMPPMMPQPFYHQSLSTPPPVYRSSNSLSPYATNGATPALNPSVTQHASHCNLMNPALQRQHQQQHQLQNQNQQQSSMNPSNGLYSPGSLDQTTNK